MQPQDEAGHSANHGARSHLSRHVLCAQSTVVVKCVMVVPAVEMQEDCLITL